MNKRIRNVFLNLGYLLIVVLLLYIQFQSMENGIEKMTAMLLTIFLAVVGMLLMLAYQKEMEQSRKEKKVKHNCQNTKSAVDNSEKQKRNDFPSLVEVYNLLEELGLSPREVEVAWLICKGYKNLQIAEELYISETTVKKHGTHIYEKLQVGGRKELKNFILEKINSK